MLAIWYHLWVFMATLHTLLMLGRSRVTQRTSHSPLSDSQRSLHGECWEKVGMTPTQPWHCTASDVGGDLCAHPAQPLLQQGHPQQVAQAHIQMASEDLHEGVSTTCVGTSRKLGHQAYPPTGEGEKPQTHRFRTPPKHQFDIRRVALWYSLPHCLFKGVFDLDGRGTATRDSCSNESSVPTPTS